MNHNLFFAACFFMLNSLRYIFFGLWNDFHSIGFNFVQFIAFNNHLNKNEHFGVGADIIFWIFFGLSPHPNSDGSIDHIYYSLYGHDSDDNDNSNNSTYRYLTTSNGTDTDNDELQEINDWFNDNKFLITSTVLFTIISVTFMGYMIFAIINIYRKK